MNNVQGCSPAIKAIKYSHSVPDFIANTALMRFGRKKIEKEEGKV